MMEAAGWRSQYRLKDFLVFTTQWIVLQQAEKDILSSRSSLFIGLDFLLSATLLGLFVRPLKYVFDFLFYSHIFIQYIVPAAAHP